MLHEVYMHMYMHMYIQPSHTHTHTHIHTHTIAKKNPRQDLAHLQLANTEPLVEGEAPLIRTGSDPCLNETSSPQVHVTGQERIRTGD